MSTSATPATALKPTPQQAAFLTALTDTTDHLVLRARAGCGKTSAILMGVDTYTAKFPSAEILVCAYNKAIADEVSGKLKAHGHTDWRKIQACTLHSLGFGLLKFIFKPEVDDKKVAKLVRRRAESDNLRTAAIFDQYGAQIIQLVRYAKQAGVGFFGDMQIGDASVWYDLADHFDVNGFDDTTEMDKVIGAAQVIYRDSLNQTDVIDYDDMILIPLIKSLRVKFTKDVIFLDEAQDLSRARQALARKFIKPGTGRMIVVGDDRQAIYGFSGADSQALSNLTTDLGAKVLPLSVAWRCPKAVVKVAQRFVSDLEAAETAPEGRVITTRDFPNDLTATDAVLCRNTAPLITLAYEIIRSGKPCKVEGRSIGEGLIALAQRWKVNTTPALLNKLYDYENRETQKAMAKGNEQKAMDISDRVQTLREIITAVNHQGKHDVADVVSFINGLFADGVDSCTTLATYHRSKGREWERVILYEHGERCPSKAARQQWQKDQEDNLQYVAVTRAKNTLVFYELE